jgi:hypothetical protein
MAVGLVALADHARRLQDRGPLRDVDLDAVYGDLGHG